MGILPSCTSAFLESAVRILPAVAPVSTTAFAYSQMASASGSKGMRLSYPPQITMGLIGIAESTAAVLTGVESMELS